MRLKTNWLQSSFCPFIIMIFCILGITSQGIAARIGNNYEQQQLSVDGTAMPSARIETHTAVEPGETVDAFVYAVFVDEQNEGEPFYHWYADKGSFSPHPSFPDYSVVQYTAPNTSGQVNITVEVGDGLGHVGYDTFTITVGEGGTIDPGDLPAPENAECTYTLNPSGWKQVYHTEYLLTIDRTANDKPVGHFSIQPEFDTQSWDYSGHVQVIINGSPVTLYEDPNLQIAHGPSYGYHPGGQGFELWFDADFSSNKSINLHQSEDSAFEGWDTIWFLKPSCPVDPAEPGTQDLKVELPEVTPNIVKPGEAVQTRFRVKNIGTGWSDPSKVGYYLSVNGGKWDSSDIRLWQDDVPTLISEGTSIHEFSVTIPEDAPTGDHFLIFRADDNEEIDDINRINNEVFVEIGIRDDADLVPLAPSVTGSVIAGNTITASVRIQNNGSLGTPGSSRVGYYLSTNGSEWDESDMLLGTGYFGFLAPGDYQDFTRTISIPAGTPGGTHYFIFYADYAGLIPESNEDNNFAPRPVNVTAKPPGGQDLVVASASPGTPSVNLGENLTVYAQVKNIGTDYMRSTMLGYYFSTDEHLDSSDVFKGEDRIDAMWPDMVSQENARLGMPSDIPTGQYYIIFVANYTKSQPESNELNNFFVMPILLTSPDLKPSNLVVSKPEVSAGNAVDMNVQVTNIGDGKMSRYTESYIYLSKDSQYDSSDIYLSTVTVIETLPNATKNYQAFFGIPSNTTPGNYRLLFVTDRYNDIIESDEMNNDISIQLIIKPANNLPVVNAGADAKIVQNKIFILNGSFTDTDTNDSHMASIDWGDGTPSSSAAIDQNKNISASHTYTAKGTYTVNVSVSDNNQGAGSDTLTVTVQAPDSDGDGFADPEDLFPDDPKEWTDADNDGAGDNGDKDDDNDGMSDEFELQYGLDHQNPDDANIDSDNDGFTNLEEAKGNSNPNDAQSQPQAEITQEIILSAGWNLISLNIYPEIMTPESIFASVADKLLEVKNISQTYDPSLPGFLNTLTELEDGMGYWVNMDQAATLSVTGSPADLESLSIPLKAGWNLIGYPCQEAKPAEDALAGIMDVLLEVKNISQSYDPSLPVFLNTLTSLTPDFGYWINVSSDTYLNYPPDL